MNAVQIVTVASKYPLYKGEQIAERIELINLKEVGFDLVSQKDLYMVGDKVFFIQPDYCLPDTPLFEGFIRPNGEESKSMLGKIEGVPRRIRAKKFNFSKIPNGDVVYSNGILLPFLEVSTYYPDIFDKEKTFDEILNITKYEEPEIKQGGLKLGKSSSFPEGVYKTDEINIYNKLGHITFPITLVGTEKIDGSSITIGIIDNEPIVCSRNMKKPLTYNKCIGNRKKTFWEKLFFWKNVDLKIYETHDNDTDDFVKYSKYYLQILKENEVNNVLFRGELNGGSLKGSGNKNNPSRKEEINIKFFGFDIINNSGISEKQPYYEFEQKCNNLNFPRVKEIFYKTFNSFQEIIDECNLYFKDNLIEGIVVRSLDSKFSAKVMNLEYDSKK